MLTQAVVERIKGAIESGTLRAGSAIGQQELADRLGVSRQPIRQALPLLIAEGWIQSLPNRRLLVRELAAEEVDEIFAVRRLLEPVALAASIAHATPAMLRRLQFALTEYEEAATPAEAAAFGEVVTLTVPLRAVPDLACDLASSLVGKVVIDTGNAYEKRDGQAARVATAHSQGSAGWAAAMFPGSRCVKAFNTVYFKTLVSEAHRAGDRVGIPLAGDDTHDSRW